MGYQDFLMKVNSIPEYEPLYTMIKARAINLNKIKDKDERKKWKELKEVYAIPDIYKTQEELDKEIKELVNKGGIKNVK